ncbi:outer membrane protein [Novosphingobium pentaromativorans]|nr:outer membrane beta-barrel protein [Novosphingobium pentaromativorans]AIT81309.1 hypothetical protein JI59_16740 [Novosphingobium pentaromativorans US6-1]
MKKFAIAGAAAALFVVPAAANAQAWVQAESGVDIVSVEGESNTGFGYGVSAGYDLALAGGMFVGVQGTFADSDTKRCVRDVMEAGDKACLEAGRDVAALLRFGTAITSQSKLYVMAGYANARADVTYDGPSVEAIEDELGVNGGIGAHGDLDGVRLGAGYEYALNDKLFVKTEYRYTNYENDFSRHAGVVALGARF